MQAETDRIICTINESNVAHVRFKKAQLAEALDAAEIATDLREIVCPKEFRGLVIDCEGLTLATSALLEAFLSAYVRCRKQGREVRIANASPLVFDVLHITKFDQLMHVYERLDDALLF